MAVRRWRAIPDQVMQTPEGEVGVVSRDEQISAILDAVALCDRSGGVFTVAYGRFPTDMPGESVTTGVVVEWASRTDAKAQPEPQVDVLPREEPDPAIRALEDEMAESSRRDYEALPASDEPDGLDPSTLEEEDVSSIPEHAR